MGKPGVAAIWADLSSYAGLFRFPTQESYASLEDAGNYRFKWSRPVELRSSALLLIGGLVVLTIGVAVGWPSGVIGAVGGAWLALTGYLRRWWAFVLGVVVSGLFGAGWVPTLVLGFGSYALGWSITSSVMRVSYSWGSPRPGVWSWLRHPCVSFSLRRIDRSLSRLDLDGAMVLLDRLGSQVLRGNVALRRSLAEVLLHRGAAAIQSLDDAGLVPGLGLDAVSLCGLVRRAQAEIVLGRFESARVDAVGVVSGRAASLNEACRGLALEVTAQALVGLGDRAGGFGYASEAVRRAARHGSLVDLSRALRVRAMCLDLQRLNAHREALDVSMTKFRAFGRNQHQDRLLQPVWKPVLSESMMSTVEIIAHSESDEEEIELFMRGDGILTLSVALDSFLAAARVRTLQARLLLGEGDGGGALVEVLAGLATMDAHRYGLRSQVDRERWSVQYGDAIGVALDAALLAGDDVAFAELVELGRVQAVPDGGSGRGGAGVGEQGLSVSGSVVAGLVGEIPLQPPPAVGVDHDSVTGYERSLASLEQGAPISGESVSIRAAARAVGGPGTWWWGMHVVDDRLFWSVVPPDGSPTSGVIGFGEGSVLRQAVAEVDAALPGMVPGESSLRERLRVEGGVLWGGSIGDERALMRYLGVALLPPALSDVLTGRDVSDPVPLAIAAPRELGHLPWPILGVADFDDDGVVRRLVEAAEITLVPSVALIDLIAQRPSVEGPWPVDLAVVNPGADLEESDLVVSHLPRDAVVLGPSGGVVEEATRVNLVAALGSQPRALLFAGHSDRAESGVAASGGGLRLVASGGGFEYLRAADLLLGVDEIVMPPRVILSSCESADLSGARGGEWLTLAPSVLLAGCETAVVTVFDLVDDPGVAGISRVEERLVAGLGEGRDLPGLLREQQLADLESWRVDQSVPPLFWAPFVVTGISPRRESAAADLHTVPDLPPLSNDTIDLLAEAYKMYIADRKRLIARKSVYPRHVVATYVWDTHEVLLPEGGLPWLPRLLQAGLSGWFRTGGNGTTETGILTDDLARALKAASVLARDLKAATVQPEHLLFAILDEDDESALRPFRVSPHFRDGQTRRRRIVSLLRERGAGDESQRRRGSGSSSVDAVAGAVGEVDGVRVTPPTSDHWFDPGQSGFIGFSEESGPTLRRGEPAKRQELGTTEELESVAREHLSRKLGGALQGETLMQICWREGGRVSCTSLIGDLEESRQDAADRLARPNVDQVVFTATRSVGSTREVYCEAFDDTGAGCAVACAYRKLGLAWVPSGEIHGVEPPEQLPETTALRQARLGFDGFVEEALSNPLKALYVGRSVCVYLPSHRQDGIEHDPYSAVHSLDEAGRLASDVRGIDYFGVVFRTDKAVTIAAWDLSSEKRIAFRIPVRKSVLGPIRVSGHPERLPPPPLL